MNWTLGTLVRATGAELIQWGAGPFRGISTDSRRIAAGEVFLALHGPNHDGHDFLDVVQKRGASGAIVARDFPPAAEGLAWMRVGDGLRALGDLAATRRRELRARVVGITGSNGKTTTKEMIAAVLTAAGRRVAWSHGTENNLVGLPQTLLRLAGDEDFVVLEMGMNHPGEIWRLAEISRPEVGVVTNVGPAHLEGLGSLANVAAAKGELALALDSGATLVLGCDDLWGRSIAKMFSGRTIFAGDAGPVRAVSVEAQGRSAQRMTLEIDGRRASAELRCLGAHNVANALTAATVGHVFGLDVETIAAGLEAFVPLPMRLERHELPSGAKVLNDAYNANPASMAAALAALAAEPAQRRIAVLGEMWELGSAAVDYHHEVGKLAAKASLDRLVAVGRYAKEMAAGAIEGGLANSRVQCCTSAAEAADILAPELGRGDVVLVKGSRGARMEDVIRALGAER